MSVVKPARSMLIITSAIITTSMHTPRPNRTDKRHMTRTD
jgi:hypothetical protein